MRATQFRTAVGTLFLVFSALQLFGQWLHSLGDCSCSHCAVVHSVGVIPEKGSPETASSAPTPTEQWNRDASGATTTDGCPFCTYLGTSFQVTPRFHCVRSPDPLIERIESAPLRFDFRLARDRSARAPPC